MKEFVEKLIGRLEEYKYSHLVEHDKERLEHCTENERAEHCEGIDCFWCVWEKAIEIVNQLAEEYNNGFCEWKLDGVYLLCQHNTELVISCLEEEKHRYTYCPYCGKKIKVVETYKEGSEE